MKSVVLPGPAAAFVSAGGRDVDTPGSTPWRSSTSGWSTSAAKSSAWRSPIRTTRGCARCAGWS